MRVAKSAAGEGRFGQRELIMEASDPLVSALGAGPPDPHRYDLKAGGQPKKEAVGLRDRPASMFQEIHIPAPKELGPHPLPRELA